MDEHEPGAELEPVDNRRHQIEPWLQHQLCRDLAEGVKTRAALAREHGVTRQAITKFAQRHRDRIAEIKAHLDDEFAGLWVARKSSRLSAYQRDLELIEGIPHHEWVKARTGILKAVAEETGQLPPRMQIAVAPVIHIIETNGEIDIERDLT